MAVVVFVRARGLGDISRLPIRCRQWTRSNYCCSYRLINLSLSRSLSLPPPRCSCDLFPSRCSSEGNGREKNGSSDGAPHRKRARGGNETQAEPDRCHTPGLRGYRTEVCMREAGVGVGVGGIFPYFPCSVRRSALGRVREDCV